MHVIAFAILALQTSLVNSCTKTEKMYQCKGEKLREQTCSGVSPRPCNLYQLKCGCASNRRLRDDGKCVLPEQCSSGAVQPNNEYPTASENETYSHALQLIQGSKDLHLLLITEDTWISSICRCMKSSFAASTGEKSERSVECYDVKTTLGKPVRVTKAEKKVLFRVEQERGHQTTLSLNTKDGGKLPFDMGDTYTVLYARPTCMVLAVGDGDDGKPQCILWGLEDAQNSDEEGCFKVWNRMCAQPTIDVWQLRDPCAKHDALVAEYEKRNHSKK